MKKLHKIVIQNFILFAVVTILVDRRKKNYSERLIMFLLPTIILEFSNFISYETLKVWICTPIEPSNLEMRNTNELVLIKHDFNQNNRFINTHYLQNLVYIYEHNLKTSYLPNNTLSFLTSKDSILESKYKITRVLDDFYRNVNKINAPNKQNESALIKYLNYNFEFSDLFTQTSSFTMLNYTTRLLTLIIQSFLKKLLYESFYEKSESPTKNISNNQNITYFYETLLFLEDTLENLLKHEKYSAYYKRNEYLSQEIKYFHDLLRNRIRGIKNKLIESNFQFNHIDKF